MSLAYRDSAPSSQFGLWHWLSLLLALLLGVACAWLVFGFE